MSRSTAVSCESASSTIGIDEAVQFVERQTFLSIVRCGVRHHLRRQNRTMVQYSTVLYTDANPAMSYTIQHTYSYSLLYSTNGRAG